jgi:hypothetical protein
MSKKLLSLLAEEIKEQGFGRYFRDATLPSGQRIGDVKSVDLSTGKPIDITISNTEVLPNEVEDDKDEDDKDVEEGTYAGPSLININKLNTSNYYSGASKRGKTYGWRGPIWSLCPKNTRYCDWHWHAGRDYADSRDTPIAILKKGVIQNKGEVCFSIKFYDNSTSRFCHCDSVYFNNGQTVLPGDIVATVGNKGNSTGPHLHWEYYPSTKNCRTETHNSVKGSTVEKKVCDVDPSGIEDNYFVFVKKVKKDNFKSDIVKIRGLG